MIVPSDSDYKLLLFCSALNQRLCCEIKKIKITHQGALSYKVQKQDSLVCEEESARILQPCAGSGSYISCYSCEVTLLPVILLCFILVTKVKQFFKRLFMHTHIQ